ncbi:MAG: IS1096 element passenger TnpR family protein [Terriglobia bacterium]
MNETTFPIEIYQFRIVLRETSPHIWRRLLVPSDSTLIAFHHVIQTAFGWSGRRSLAPSVDGSGLSATRHQPAAVAPSLNYDREVTSMKVRIQAVIETDDGQVQDVQDVFDLHRGELKPERLGLTLQEGKGTREGVHRILAARQIEEYMEAQRRCPACDRQRTHKGQHEIMYRTLFGRLRMERSRT